MTMRFSAALAPSIEMPPSFRSSIAPGAWRASEVKSRPCGSRSNSSLERLVARVACVIARRGEPATASTRSAMPAGRSVRSIVKCAPSTSATSATLAVSTRRVRSDLVPAGRQRGISIPAGRVRHDLQRPAVLVRDRHQRARQNAVLHVTDDALDGTRLLLACYRCAARRQQVTAAAMSRCTALVAE